MLKSQVRLTKVNSRQEAKSPTEEIKPVMLLKHTATQMCSDKRQEFSHDAKRTTAEASQQNLY